MVSYSDAMAFVDFNYIEEGRNTYPFFPFLLWVKLMQAVVGKMQDVCPGVEFKHVSNLEAFVFCWNQNVTEGKKLKFSSVFRVHIITLPCGYKWGCDGLNSDSPLNAKALQEYWLSINFLLENVWPV